MRLAPEIAHRVRPDRSEPGKDALCRLLPSFAHTLLGYLAGACFVESFEAECVDRIQAGCAPSGEEAERDPGQRCEREREKNRPPDHVKVPAAERRVEAERDEEAKEDAAEHAEQAAEDRHGAGLEHELREDR